MKIEKTSANKITNSTQIQNKNTSTYLKFDRIDISPAQTLPLETLKAYGNIQKTSLSQKVTNTLIKKKEDFDIPLSALTYLVNNIENINDKTVKNELNRLFNLINIELKKKQNTDSSKIFDILIEISCLTDAINCAQNKYCTIGSSDFAPNTFSETKNYYTKLKSLDRQKLESLNYSLKKELGEKISETEDEIYQDSYFTKNIENVKDFLSQQKFEKLKEYLADPSMGSDGLKDYLYEKYYLSSIKIPETIKNLSRKINQEFGTKMFYSAKTNFEQEPQLIYNELKNWENVSNKTFTPPTIIDINYADETFLGESKAYMYYPKIVMRPNTNNTWLNLRHELAHLNDRYQFSLPQGSRAIAQDILEKHKYKNELAAAGISQRQREYAYTNENEFIAVCATGNSNYYSKDLKKSLIKLGLPEYVFKLPPLFTENQPEVMLDYM